MQNIQKYITENKQRFLDELIELLKIPSVSADSAFSQDVHDTADAVKIALENAGCDAVEICETDGYPIVYGEKFIDSKLPTVLVYGHYDVQPPDPMDMEFRTFQTGDTRNGATPRWRHICPGCLRR